MIGRLRGTVAHRGADHLLIDVGGVGYVVHCTDALRTGVALGHEAVLWTEMVVREDLMQLFGFASLEEREWHRLLTSVQGVGAKVSLAILGALGPQGVGRAVALTDAASMRAAPGVGPKLAQRIVNELAGKAPALAALAGDDPLLEPAAPDAAGPAPARAAPPATAAGSAARAEALSALANLGYAPADAARAVAEAGADGEDTPTLIRGALKRLAPER